ncbi:MAG: amidohydrolase [Azospirillaceae bacterium]|nr:amidohydrolase [Azospirillaceae bacterium]
MLETIKDALPQLVALRRELHNHPELSCAEARTATVVAESLRALGAEVHTGIGGHGIVASLHGSGPGPAVALRADMDALAIVEQTGLPYASGNPGTMHACGHDGHMVMAIGGAMHLARTRQFRGTVHVIFQPAEERFGGALRMIEDGLFDRFPVERVFGLHNWPGLEAGAFVVHDGPVMAGTGEFGVVFTAAGGHAAMPHTTGDPVLAGSLFVAGVQQIVARAVDPLQAAVVTIGSFQAGHAQNIIADQAVLTGTFRAHRPALLMQIAQRLQDIAGAAATMAGTGARMRIEGPLTAPVVNSVAEAALMRQAVTTLFGTEALRVLPPSMAGDDFGCLLAHVPGAYIWIGNGAGTDSAPLHRANYDFNDAILGRGASVLARVAELALGG